METVKQHLSSRYLDTDIHPTWISEELKCCTFPIWNLTGQLIGYQRYRPNAPKTMTNDPREGRYFTRIKDGKVGVWGLESWHFSNTLFITEGVFDACRLTNKGASAVALFSYAVSKTSQNWLHTVRQSRPVVAVCDNDSSGLKLRKYGHIYHVVEKDDLGDASEEYVESLIGKFAHE